MKPFPVDYHFVEHGAFLSNNKQLKPPGGNYTIEFVFIIRNGGFWR